MFYHHHYNVVNNILNDHNTYKASKIWEIWKKNALISEDSSASSWFFFALIFIQKHDKIVQRCLRKILDVVDGSFSFYQNVTNKLKLLEQWKKDLYHPYHEKVLSQNKDLAHSRKIQEKRSINLWYIVGAGRFLFWCLRIV